uniref:Leucine-rich repeat-containing N-terminal plant-type domain-containing protein n=1 Tax=Physcomitrium patens TaxID=3218 RepID=A0A7I4E4Q3_PHYPA
MATGDIFLSVIVLCLGLPFAVGTSSSDVAALQELLRAWQGTSAVFEGWTLREDADPCGSRWKGIVCSPTQSVINLDLSGNPMLKSTIPKQIGLLHRLKHLKLSGCNFHGRVPQEIYELIELEYLDLSNNPHLSLDEDAEYLTSLKQQSSSFSRRRLLQASRRTPLPISYTYIAVVCVGLVTLMISTFCFCRWLSLRRTRNDHFLAMPTPPLAPTMQPRRIYANQADDDL